jgi:hypothetical protein
VGHERGLLGLGDQRTGVGIGDVAKGPDVAGALRSQAILAHLTSVQVLEVLKISVLGRDSRGLSHTTVVLHKLATPSRTQVRLRVLGIACKPKEQSYMLLLLRSS